MNSTENGLAAFFGGKRVVVTGAGGSIGGALVEWLSTAGAEEVRALDNHEGHLADLDERYRNNSRVMVFFSDIRSSEEINLLFRGMDYVFHCAALKHVPLCERSPFETTQTNIDGVQNVIRAAMERRVDRVLFTSSDKAVNPTNVMGTSKLMGERLITAANALTDHLSETLFTCTRFGNVAGSQGSVIPLFCKQIAAGGPVTITNRQMSRFVMTLDEAVRLVLESMTAACGGEVFVTKMPVINIATLAEVMIEQIAPLFGYRPADIEVVEIGERPGEKLYEELTTQEEIRRTLEMENMFVVLPAFRNIYNRINYDYSDRPTKPVDRMYLSSEEPALTKQEVGEFLNRPKVLPDEIAVRLQ